MVELFASPSVAGKCQGRRRLQKQLGAGALCRHPRGLEKEVSTLPLRMQP